MLGKFIEAHQNDLNGNPTGGTTTGIGFVIDWQDGPLMLGGRRREPNGAFVETVIAAVIGRIQHYERSKFACDTNKEAIAHLQMALEALDRRTKDREARGVEGEHKV